MLKLIFVVALAISAPALADEHRELGPHEHGHGTLNVAVEGNTIKMELEVPGDDIIGFEHDPSTPEEKAAMETAKKILANPLGLFKIADAAKCSVKEAKVSIQDEKHEHEEKDAKSDAGAASADKHEDAEAHHNEFFITYALDCKSMPDVKSIDFEYFKAFKNGQELNVNVITPKGQSKFEATRDKPRVDLSGLM